MLVPVIVFMAWTRRGPLYTEESDQVHTGNDDKSTNAKRKMWLKACNGCGAITVGHDIYFADATVTNKKTGAVNKQVLAHEMTHVGQFEDWGALGYVVGGGLTQFFNLFEDQYSVPLPMGRNWTRYGMEQQATIVEQCYAGVQVYCANSPYSFPQQP
jgi:hypothetical protein